jgi:hypothetical protein
VVIENPMLVVDAHENKGNKAVTPIQDFYIPSQIPPQPCSILIK